MACALLSITLHADTLVLRDGRRVQGTLLAVRDDVVEFETERGGVLEAAIAFASIATRSCGSSSTMSAAVLTRALVAEGRPVSASGMSGSRRARPGATPASPCARVRRCISTRRGRVRWGPGRQDGPEGERGSPRNDARPIPSRPAAALIGRVGDGDDYFFIGDVTEGIRMRAGGRLYLGINDDFLNDNSGAFTVAVSY